MSDLTLAYRPQKLEDVIGQDTVVRTLRASVKRGACRAYLFAGPSGAGKTTLARIVAASRSAELIEINGASNSTIDDCRRLAQETSQPRLGVGCVAVLLDECQRLGKQSWDCLLKPIEEAPDFLIWLFCTTEPDRVREAIVNRCEVYTLRPVSPDVIEAHLEQVAAKEKIAVKPGVLEYLAESAEGSVRQALRWLGQVRGLPLAEVRQICGHAGGEDKEIVDFCRAIMKSGGAWSACASVLKQVEATPESVRRVVVNYFTKVAQDAKTIQQAAPALRVLDAFSEPYPTEERAHLLLSLARLNTRGGGQ